MSVTEEEKADIARDLGWREKLKARFPDSEHKWRKGPGGLMLVYIDARAVMERLDEVFGPAGWSDTYRYVDGRTFCELSCRPGDEWSTKSDSAGDTDIEGDKGATADAFKRAAVKWGIGRYLYSMKPTRTPPKPSEPIKEAKPVGKRKQDEVWKLAVERAASVDEEMKKRGDGFPLEDSHAKALITAWMEKMGYASSNDLDAPGYAGLKEWIPTWDAELFVQFEKSGQLTPESEDF